MQSLGFFDQLWRVVVAAVLALTPGVLFWTLVLGLGSLLGRLNHRRWLFRQAEDAARP